MTDAQTIRVLAAMTAILVGHSTPGGLSEREVQSILQALARAADVDISKPIREGGE